MSMPEQRYDDLSYEMKLYLRDTHPRGPQIIAEMKARDARDQPEIIEMDVPPYSEWTLEELKAETKARGLRTSGTKEDLAARLDKNDMEATE